MEFADLRALAERWIADDPDPSTRDELRALVAARDEAELSDRFATGLTFGTAGLRGVIGAGPNRMNRAVVARATWGLVDEILASVPRARERVVVVGGDGRRLSRELAEDVAAIVAGAGLRVVLFRDPVPTPLVGYTVKRLGAAAGVVITASHNPPEYNGYKVYWENAVQIVPPTDARIASAIARAPAACAIARPDLDALMASGRVEPASAAFADGYVSAVQGLAVHPGAGDRSLSIVYTPLHGVGDALVRRVLAASGFAHVATVPEQQSPDPAFPTVAFPNPEEHGVMDRAFDLARRLGADLVLANDPDVDRLAVGVPAPDGSATGYVQLTGNDVGALLGAYLLTEGPARPDRPRAVLASIVSSPLLGRIAADLGVAYEETLTGFKWIAKRAVELERSGTAFVFGYEEALGYCIGNVVHDKDGISAALLVAELAAVLRARGETLHGALDAIARRHGVFVSAQSSVTRKGTSGAAAIAAMMAALRAAPPAHIAGDGVVAVSDYERSERRDLRTGQTSPIALPKSNVLAFELASGSRVVARPSGTEPKAKFYFDVREPVGATERVEGARARALESLARLVDAFSGMVTVRG